MLGAHHLVDKQLWLVVDVVATIAASGTHEHDRKRPIILLLGAVSKFGVSDQIADHGDQRVQILVF